MREKSSFTELNLSSQNCEFNSKKLSMTQKKKFYTKVSVVGLKK